MGEEGPREACGLFGAFAPGEDVARLTFFGLFALQHRGEPMQLRIAKTLRLDRFHRGQYIVAIVARSAVALQHVAKLIGRRQPAGILYVAAVDHEGDSTDPLPRFVLEPDRPHHLAVDIGGLLAAAQIIQRSLAQLRRDVLLALGRPRTLGGELLLGLVEPAPIDPRPSAMAPSWLVSETGLGSSGEHVTVVGAPLGDGHTIQAIRITG